MVHAFFFFFFFHGWPVNLPPGLFFSPFFVQGMDCFSPPGPVALISPFSGSGLFGRWSGRFFFLFDFCASSMLLVPPVYLTFFLSNFFPLDFFMCSARSGDPSFVFLFYPRVPVLCESSVGLLNNFGYCLSFFFPFGPDLVLALLSFWPL